MSKYQVGELVEYWIHSKGKGPGKKVYGVITEVFTGEHYVGEEYNTYTILGESKYSSVSRYSASETASKTWNASEDYNLFKKAAA